jgi:hypothetical protein
MDAVRGPSLDPRLLRLARHSSAALRALTKLDLLLTVVIPVLLPARRSRAMLRTLAVRHLPVRGVVAAGVDALMFFALVASLRLPVPLNPALMGDGQQ